MASDAGEPGMEHARFYVCATCGQLKHEDLYREGDCTCQNCYDRGDSASNWREAPDGDGYLATKQNRNQTIDCYEADQ